VQLEIAEMYRRKVLHEREGVETSLVCGEIADTAFVMAPPMSA
jgi:hypothetical protein